MGFSRKSLVALTFATLACATPLIAEPIFSRDLEVRQDAPTECNSNNYTSRNGLNFTLYCGQNNPQNDVPNMPLKVTTFTGCLERCSFYWGSGEGCFGIVWRAVDTQCWLRTSNTSTKSLEKLDGHYSALVDRTQMKGTDDACPATDNSVKTLDGVDGMGYTVNCNKNIGAEFDLCYDDPNYPCLDFPYNHPYHTSTLEACVRICIDLHPLCKGVVWNPGQEVGYTNCIPKTNFPGNLPASTLNPGTFHSATITRIDTIDKNCPTSKQIKTQGNKAFDIHCGQLNSGTNITSIHTQNVTACVDACAVSDQKCIGVVFDSSLSYGFKNCYLQNTTNTISDKPAATYALLSGSPVPSSSDGASTSSPSSQPGNTGSSSSASSSKAWIAGPVIGGLAGIGLLAFAILFWRRKKAAAARNNPGSAPLEKDGDAYAGHYEPAPSYSSPPIELAQTEANHSELPGSTKYAAHKRGSDHAVELP